MSKLTLIFIALFLIASVFGAYQYGINRSLMGIPVSSPSPEPSASINTSFSISSSSPKASQTPSPSPSEEAKATGAVSGRLCFPSESLPAGKIIAKRLSDDKIFSQNYPGTGNGGGITYKIELDEGEYYLKYETVSNQNGYHTDICPTGLETTCGDAKRENVKVKVQPGQTVTNFDLCDFYYQSASEPKF